HPFIFSGIKKITHETELGKKILKLAENKVAVYSIHTNADFALNGLNDFVMDKLELDGETRIFNQFEFDDYNYIKNKNEKAKCGTARIKILDNEMKLTDLIERIKVNLGLDYVRYVGENRNIRRIGLVTGGGSSFLNSVKKEIDVFLTGDLRHHEALDTVEEGGILIDIGHYESEYLFSDLMEVQLSKFFKGEVIKYFGETIFKLG
ncbi:MAG: Nif3-like dinuclear metal center hexameric protein, partial [Leptotrichiaceae bacterium]|nr:Nif3-like dinuclear metal center hexameric protein [Leptotrichiaceae bacterium]